MNWICGLSTQYRLGHSISFPTRTRRLQSFSCNSKWIRFVPYYSFSYKQSFRLLCLGKLYSVGVGLWVISHWRDSTEIPSTNVQTSMAREESAALSQGSRCSLMAAADSPCASEEMEAITCSLVSQRRREELQLMNMREVMESHACVCPFCGALGVRFSLSITQTSMADGCQNQLFCHRI